MQTPSLIHTQSAFLPSRPSRTRTALIFPHDIPQEVPAFPYSSFEEAYPEAGTNSQKSAGNSIPIPPTLNLPSTVITCTRKRNFENFYPQKSAQKKRKSRPLKISTRTSRLLKISTRKSRLLKISTRKSRLKKTRKRRFENFYPQKSAFENFYPQKSAQKSAGNAIALIKSL